MSSDQVRKLLQEGIAAARAGQTDQARKLLQQALKIDPRNEVGWLAMVSLTPDSRDRLRILKRVLEINPKNEKARELATRMGVPPEKLIAPAESADRPAPPPASSGMDHLRAMMDEADEDEEAPPEAAPFFDEEPHEEEAHDFVARMGPAREEPEDDDFSLEGAAPQMGEFGVPVPDRAKLQSIARQAEEIAQIALHRPRPLEEVEWRRKNKRRAGERDVWTLRLQVGAAIVAFLVVVGGLGALLVATNPDVQKAVLEPTRVPPTLTPTSTLTPTATLGVTPTFSPTPELTYTPSPTLDPLIPTGHPQIQPRPTDYYLPDSVALDPRLVEALQLIEQQEYDDAIERLQEVKLQSRPGYPYPYYLLSQIDLRRGSVDDAEANLQEGEAALANAREDSNFRPMIDLGLAQLALARAQQEIENGNARGARNFYPQIETPAARVIDQDPRLAEAFVVLAQRYAAEGNFDRALQVINEGLVSLPEANIDLRLRLAKAQLYYQNGDFAAAGQEAYDMLQINPYSEAAHQMQINAALQRGEPGLAVIHAERYLFFYPGSIQANKLLGDARRDEGKVDLALNAYTRALLGDASNPDFVAALLARADLYLSEGRAQAALDDYTSALDFTDALTVRADRMRAAYASGNFSTARRDSEALLGQGIVADAELLLLQAQILVQEADEGDSARFEEARDLVERSRSQNLAEELRPTADEVLARAQYGLGNHTQALEIINRALSAGETGSRHYLRGLIFEALDNLPAARSDYEWVLTWSQVFPYPFRQDTQARYERVNELILNPPEPTPTPES